MNDHVRWLRGIGEPLSDDEQATLFVCLLYVDLPDWAGGDEALALARLMNWPVERAQFAFA